MCSLHCIQTLNQKLSSHLLRFRVLILNWFPITMMILWSDDWVFSSETFWQILSCVMSQLLCVTHYFRLISCSAPRVSPVEDFPWTWGLLTRFLNELFLLPRCHLRSVAFAGCRPSHRCWQLASAWVLLTCQQKEDISSEQEDPPAVSTY